MITARDAALSILVKMEEGEKIGDLLNALPDAHPAFKNEDIRLVRRLVKGTKEEQLYLDYLIDQVSKLPAERMKPVIRNALRMGFYQKAFMDRVPPRAAIYETVASVKKTRQKSLAGFVNGVLRSAYRKTDWAPVPEYIKLGLPEWMMKLFVKEFGEENTAKMAAAFKGPQKVYIRFRGDASLDGKRIEILKACGVDAEKASFPERAWSISGSDDIRRIPLFAAGEMTVQDISSMLVGHLAGKLGGETVLDVCAAPGGKSLFAADVLPDAMVLSCDKSDRKCALISENTARAGAPNIKVICQDAAAFVPEWEEAMDIVIADLPCSGLGVLGRKPDIKYNASPSEIAQLAKLQREILDNVRKYVRPGGVLIYSTCTVTKEENEGGRDYILSHSSLVPEDITPLLPEVLQSRETAREGYIRTLPGIDPCDGFFISVFRKKI